MPYQQHEAWDYFPVRLSLKMIMDPFSVIREFFDQEIDIVDVRKELNLWWQSAFSDECLLSKAEMIALIGFRDQLVKLVEAAGLLLPDGNVEIITMEEADLLNPANFCSALHEGYTAWDYFPRNLSKSEFVNPQIMVSKFFAHKNLPEWRDIVDELFSAAISDCSICTCTNEKEILKACEYVSKLMEALYLLKVRKGSH